MPNEHVIKLHKIKTSQTQPWDIDGTKISRLQVIFKVVERCNINCSYCYYFNSGDSSYLDRPPVAPRNFSKSLAKFLRSGADDLNLDIVQIVFHGGEPMMQRKSAFDEYCSILKQAFIGGTTKLVLSIQTNGTLIDEEWLQLFHKHGVTIGISLDGPPEYNDVYRLDYKGKSTYDSTANGIRQVQQYQEMYNVNLGLGSLTVINSAFDNTKVYDHLTRELNLSSVNFLLPDACHDDYKVREIDPKQYGSSLSDLFRAWMRHPTASVRIFDDFFSILQRKKVNVVSPGAGFHSYMENAIVVIQSDGTLQMDDSLMPALNWRSAVQAQPMEQTDLRSWMAQQPFAEIVNAQRTLPDACVGCAWKRVCRGGSVENRFSSTNGFNNPSIYCESLKHLYETMLAYLCEHGYDLDSALEELARDDSLVLT